MSETIWIVEGTTGEYSDRHEWPVCAFRDEVKAKDLVVELTNLAKATEVANAEDRWDWEESETGKAWKSKDPHASMDYTGSSYTAYEITLL